MHVNNVEICHQSEVIVLAVKPYQVGKVMEEIKDHLTSDHIVVSLAAGVSVADLSQVRKKFFLVSLAYHIGDSSNLRVAAY